ncbi:hypothetical protein ABSL23_15440 [Halobacterium sp. NMX12-1]|uniref:Uncharacterized protein n=1 Tax=Halobacterium sp. NMX12-1 TaxID=3166650 RepID=A0AAU8CD20_9EURY
MEHTDELDTILETLETHQQYTEDGQDGEREIYNITDTDGYIFIGPTREDGKSAEGSLDSPTEITGEPVAETEATIVEENLTEYLEP